MPEIFLPRETHLRWARQVPPTFLAPNLRFRSQKQCVFFFVFYACHSQAQRTEPKNKKHKFKTQTAKNSTEVAVKNQPKLKNQAKDRRGNFDFVVKPPPEPIPPAPTAGRRRKKTEEGLTQKPTEKKRTYPEPEEEELTLPLPEEQKKHILRTTAEFSFWQTSTAPRRGVKTRRTKKKKKKKAIPVGGAHRGRGDRLLAPGGPLDPRWPFSFWAVGPVPPGGLGFKLGNQKEHQNEFICLFGLGNTRMKKRGGHARKEGVRFRWTESCSGGLDPFCWPCQMKDMQKVPTACGVCFDP